jgi:hypothetical protein
MGIFSCAPAGFAARRLALAAAFTIPSICALSTRAQSCIPAPAGLVGLWHGENSAGDSVSGTQGKLVNHATFAEGLVGQAFRFDGYRSGVILDDSPAYHLQSFTIEAWIRRDSASKTSKGPHGGEIFGYGEPGYSLGIEDDGSLFLTKVGIDHVTLLKAVTDTSFHHVAVTKSGSNVVFYVDGRAFPMPPYHTTFEFSTPPALGTRGDFLLNSFMGVVDEVALYNRPLGKSEIKSIFDAGSAGKCARQPDINGNPAASAVPSLTIARDGANIVLSWPATFSNFHLESSSSLGAESWSTVESEKIVQTAGNFTLTLPISDAERIYRLTSQ